MPLDGGNFKAQRKTGARFVRLYPSDWRSGCIGLSLEQEGFYIRVCAYIYESNRRLPLDDSQAAKFMGLHTNAYRKIRDQLSDLGKLVKECDGWTVRRAEKELAAALRNIQRPDQEGDESGYPDQDTGWETRQDTLGDTPIDTPQDTNRETPIECFEKINEINGHFLEPIASSHNKKESTPCKSPAGGPQPSDCLDAFNAYNETALRCGLPQAAKLTPDRARKIKARLKDYGSDGWLKALANIEQSDFLKGTNGRNWRADLDWCLQPTSFGKLHDGAYSQSQPAAAGGVKSRIDWSKIEVVEREPVRHVRIETRA